MANRTKKKRNKVYTGADAAKRQPTVTRISAVNRSRPQQWWYDNQRVVKPVGITILVVTVIVWLIIEFVQIIVG